MSKGKPESQHIIEVISISPKSLRYLWFHKQLVLCLWQKAENYSSVCPSLTPAPPIMYYILPLNLYAFVHELPCPCYLGFQCITIPP